MVKSPSGHISKSKQGHSAYFEISPNTTFFVLRWQIFELFFGVSQDFYFFVSSNFCITRLNPLNQEHTVLKNIKFQKKCFICFNESLLKWWKCFAFYFKSFFRSENIKIFVLTFLPCRKNPGNIRLDGDVLKTSWRRLSSSSSEDVFKTSSRRLDQDEYVCLSLTSSEDVFKTSSRRLGQDQYICLDHTPSRRLQDVFRTSSGRLQDVF